MYTTAFFIITICITWCSAQTAQHACCTSSNCIMTTKSDCASRLGYFLETYFCSDNPCEITGLRACCTLNGCNDTTAYDCNVKNGTFFRFNKCDEFPCTSTDSHACCNNIGCNDFDISTCLKNNSTFYPVYICSDGPCLLTNSSYQEAASEKMEEKMLFYALIAAGCVGGILVTITVIYVIRLKRRLAKIKKIAISTPLMNDINLDDQTENSYL